MMKQDSLVFVLPLQRVDQGCLICCLGCTLVANCPTYKGFEPLFDDCCASVNLRQVGTFHSVVGNRESPMMNDTTRINAPIGMTT